MSAGETHALGHRLRQQRRLLAAERLFTRLIDADAADADAWFGRGMTRADRQHYEAALADLREAARLAGTRGAILRGMARCEAAFGRFDDAERLFRQAFEVEPDYVLAWYPYALTRRFGAGDRALVDRIETLLAKPRPDPERAALHFAAAKMLDDMGDAERAFAHLERGNRAMNERLDRPSYLQFEADVKRCFDAATLARLAGCGHHDRRFVMVIGCPRSGTTLAERILAAHPDVHAAGELLDIARICDTIPAHLPGRPPYPLFGAALDARIVAGFGRAYAKRVHGLEPGAAFHVDKMPVNYWRVGVMRLLLPDAPIIALRRNPMDTCLSNYFTRYARGHAYAYDLDDMAFALATERRLMRHWHEAGANVHEVVYERLVGDPAGEGRRLAAAAGVPWRPAMIEDHASGGTISTASQWQARQPIHRRSAGRAERYAAFLGPLRDALERHGVDPDEGRGDTAPAGGLPAPG